MFTNGYKNAICNHWRRIPEFDLRFHRFPDARVRTTAKQRDAVDESLDICLEIYSMKKVYSLLSAGTLALLLAFTAADATAAGKLRVRGAAANSAGGYSGGMAAAGRGANGGAYARGRAYQTDGAGNGSVASGGAYRGPNGATGARTGTTSRTADGTVDHQSGFSANGAKGSIQSEGGFTKDADGVTQSRSTTATGANGTTYNGSTSYDKDTGLTHSGSCTDASGNSGSCR